MMNYKNYSKDAFLSMKEQYAEQGFALYQPKNNPNFIAYATREGLVHVWQFNEKDQKVTIKCVTLPNPSQLHAGVFDAIEKIAAENGWHHLHKIRHYHHHIGDERLDRDGLNPIFYAWIVEYGIETAHQYESNYTDCFDDILRESEYTSVVGLASIISEDPVELAKDFIAVRTACGDTTFEEYATHTIGKNKRVQKVRALVDEELPIGASEELRTNLCFDILRLIDDAVEKVTAE